MTSSISVTWHGPIDRRVLACLRSAHRCRRPICPRCYRCTYSTVPYSAKIYWI